MKNKARLGIIEIKNGKVLQTQLLDFDMQEYDVIPVYPDDRKYNRAKVKKETERIIERYYETDR